MLVSQNMSILVCNYVCILLCQVAIVKWSLRCLNDYPIRFGSSKPDPSACIVYIHVLPPGNTSKQNRNKYIIEIKNLA